jgi:predicted ATP-grasp superfamily ATP-dependent carboligase
MYLELRAGMPSQADRRTASTSTNRIGAAALILASSGWRLQYRTLRCAARCFDRVYVLGTPPARPLARSVACTAFHAMPSAFGADSIQLVNELCALHNIDHILPSDAETTRFVAESRHRFATRSYPVPDAATFDLLNNKHTFAGLCQKLGVPTPQTRLVSGRQELQELLADGTLTPPIVVKPLDMWGGYGVQVLGTDDAQQLAADIDYEPILVQQYIDGTDVCAFYVCSHGKVQAEAIYRLGTVEYLRHDRIRNECLKIIRRLRYDGVIGFDVRDNGKALFFLECNPRFWYNMDLVMLAGMNFVEIGFSQPADASARIATLASISMMRQSARLRTRSAAPVTLSRQRALLSYYWSDPPMAFLISMNKLSRALGLIGRQVRDSRGRTACHRRG